MSYLNYYKYYPNSTALEDINFNTNENISIEGLSFKKMFEVLTNIVKTIKDYILRLFRYIKDRVLKFLGLDKTTKTADITKLLDSYNLISDKDLTKKINEFYKTNAGEASLTNKIMLKKNGMDRGLLAMTFWLFKANGEVIDFEHLLKFTDEYANTIKGSGAASSLADSLMHIFDKYVKYNGYDITSISKIAEYYKREYTKSGVFKYLDNLKSLSDKLGNYYNTKEREVSTQIKGLEKEIKDINNNGEVESRNDYQELNDKLNSYYSYVKIVAIPSKLILEYIRLLGFINNEFASEEYTTTKDLNPTNLYHISMDNNLGKSWYKPFSKRGLNPRAPVSGLMQLLPKRICFAPEVELCFYGAPFIFNPKTNKKVKKIDDKYSEVVVTLYKGIPDSDTRYIKPEIITAGVGESMFSKEIAVTTPIKLERVGKIKIKFVTALDSWDRSKFVGYTKVE